VYNTYLLQSMKDKKFYAGSTKDLKLRFEQHNNGLVESTKNRRPFNLIYYEARLGQTDAAKTRKIYEVLQREKVSRKKAQILFNRVKRHRTW